MLENSNEIMYLLLGEPVSFTVARSSQPPGSPRFHVTKDFPDSVLR